MASFITLFAGTAIGLIPIVIPYTINDSMYIIIVTLIMFVLTTSAYIYLNTRGIKIFKKLNS